MDVSTAETGALSAGQGTAGSAVSPPLEAPPAPSSRHLLHGSAWLLVTLATGSLSGFAFWLLAARLDDPASVGRGAALLTSVLVINSATSMGLPVAVARYGVGPSAGASVLFSWALLFTAATSAIGGLVFLAVAPDAVIAPLWAWGPWRARPSSSPRSSARRWASWSTFASWLPGAGRGSCSTSWPST